MFQNYTSSFITSNKTTGKKTLFIDSIQSRSKFNTAIPFLFLILKNGVCVRVGEWLLNISLPWWRHFPWWVCRWGDLLVFVDVVNQSLLTSWAHQLTKDDELFVAVLFVWGFVGWQVGCNLTYHYQPSTTSITWEPGMSAAAAAPFLVLPASAASLLSSSSSKAAAKAAKSSSSPFGWNWKQARLAQGEIGRTCLSCGFSMCFPLAYMAIDLHTAGVWMFLLKFANITIVTG